MLAMPRADRLSLNAEGFNMPSVDHMSNRGSLNQGFPLVCPVLGC
jgi:hypothetical protein